MVCALSLYVLHLSSDMYRKVVCLYNGKMSLQRRELQENLYSGTFFTFALKGKKWRLHFNCAEFSVMSLRWSHQCVPLCEDRTADTGSIAPTTGPE